jgi:hypothetical protein
MYIGPLSPDMVIFWPIVTLLLKMKCPKDKIVIIKFSFSQIYPAHLGPWLLKLTHYRFEFKKHCHLGTQENIKNLNDKYRTMDSWHAVIGLIVTVSLKTKCLKGKIVSIKYISCQTCLGHLGPRLL